MQIDREYVVSGRKGGCFVLSRSWYRLSIPHLPLFLSSPFFLDSIPNSYFLLVRFFPKQNLRSSTEKATKDLHKILIRKKKVFYAKYFVSLYREGTSPNVYRISQRREKGALPPHPLKQPPTCDSSFSIFFFRETFPYYKSWDDRWKNSVRHNLSINPYFRKGTKARQGSGHLWTVNKSEDTSKINSWVRLKN